MSKLIQVAGDLVTDINVLRLPDARARSGQPVAGPGMRRHPGGAGFLEAVVRSAVSDLGGVTVAGPSTGATGAQPAVESLTVWAGQPTGPNARLHAWRIAERLGRFDGPHPPPDSLASGEHPTPDLLLLDDRGLGFRDEPAWWPAALTDDSTPDIVLKLGAGIGANRLWQTLTDRHADRLTVVMNIATLRARNATISRALSWDRTLEELEAEFDRGDSIADLALVRRVYILFPGAATARFDRGPSGSKLTRFVYRPDELEGDYLGRFAGRTPGGLSFLTAAVTRHLVDPDTLSDFITSARAITAARTLAETGAGSYDPRTGNNETALASFQPESIPGILARTLHQSDATLVGSLPERAFRAAVLGFPELDRGSGKAPGKHDLFGDSVGHSYEHVATIALQAALRGPDDALSGAPLCRFGHFLTYDRTESERLNELRRLIEAYRANPLDRRPLSIAVFGPPGSGKSFAIKELAREIFAGKQTILEFNLSQCSDRADLRRWFEQIRDAGIRASIPLVFWDEFDTHHLRWLADFLAPMQDSSFMVDGVAHPIGKAIFVFAGGTVSTFSAFDHSSAEGGESQAFRDRKGPDFVSRLRGYLDVKGPNPAGEDELAHLIRRALLFRSCLLRYYPHLADSTSGELAVSPSVAAGFLTVDRYRHGARSLEAIVSMSDLADATVFGPGQLPSAELLALHVSPDFLERVATDERDGTIAIVGALAASIHHAWKTQREAEGWTYAPERNDAARQHPLLAPFDQLNPNDQSPNLRSVRKALAKLRDAGLKAVPRFVAPELADAPLTPELHDRLIRIEHEAWLREHLIAGYAHAGQTNNRLLLHRNIAHFDDLSEEDRAIDAVIVDAVLSGLRAAGYRLVEVPPALDRSG